MDEIVTEGIVLRTLPFRDNDRIITVFSESTGLMKLFVRGRVRKPTYPPALVSPMVRGEFLFKPSAQGDLFRLIEGKVLDAYPNVRATLPRLNAAEEILKTLIQTHYPLKPAQRIYLLLRSYLERIPTFAHPQLLALSFKLKIIRHEGRLSLAPHCATCRRPLQAATICEGESFCSAHAPYSGITLQPAEFAAAFHLAHSRAFSQMSAITYHPSLKQKIESLWQHEVL